MHFLLPSPILRLYTGCCLDQTRVNALLVLKNKSAKMCSSFNLTIFGLRIGMKYTQNCDLSLERWNWCLSVCLDATPPPPHRPKMSLIYCVCVYSNMSLSKEHLGSRGGGPLKTICKLPVSSFQCPKVQYIVKWCNMGSDCVQSIHLKPITILKILI